MKLPLSWLKEYVDIGDISVKELADKLLNIGFEVEEIRYLGENINNVKTAKIVKITKHPNADKLQICEVDFGDEKSTIVTAATNVFEGAIVPVACDNADLPTGKHIVTGELRGVTSFGMFCSGSELCIDNNVIEGAEENGILILPSDTRLGEDIKTVLGLDEYILDISITANRADCQSILGISREIAAVLNKKLKLPSIEYSAVKTDIICPKVEIRNTNCNAYSGTVISDVNIMQSPKWMRDRLRYVGIRPINNLVDITNYVLMEIGQPLHAFDLKCIDNRIIVRSSLPNEKITALNNEIYSLSPEMMVIADENKPLAIAGVMGGEYSGIQSDTKTVFLETAKFARGNIRTTSRKLGLRSDSSARYEKGVDWFCYEFGKRRALNLFETLKAGTVTEACVYAGESIPSSKIIETSIEKINDLLGIEIPSKKVESILNLLGIDTVINQNQIICTIPAYRSDIENYTDLVEEIIRFYGYDKLSSTFIKNAHSTIGGKPIEQKKIDELKEILVSYGAYEAICFSFVNANQCDLLNLAANDKRRNSIKILNPLSEEYAVMRTQLIGSMLESVSVNLNRKNDDFRLFEIAKTYIPKQLPLTELPEENATLCLACVGNSEDFYGIKAIVSRVLNFLGIENIIFKRSDMPYLHPGMSADIFVDGNKINGNKIIGSLGKIHPSVAKNFEISESVFIAEINIQPFISEKKRMVQYRTLPKYPIVDRDLAVIIDDEVTIKTLIDCIKKYAGNVCEEVKLFDVYKGSQILSGKKSVAFSLKLRSDDHTLVDEEIQSVMNNVINGLSNELNASLRS